MRYSLLAAVLLLAACAQMPQYDAPVISSKASRPELDAAFHGYCIRHMGSDYGCDCMVEQLHEEGFGDGSMKQLLIITNVAHTDYPGRAYIDVDAFEDARKACNQQLRRR